MLHLTLICIIPARRAPAISLGVGGWRDGGSQRFFPEERLLFTGSDSPDDSSGSGTPALSGRVKVLTSSSSSGFVNVGVLGSTANANKLNTERLRGGGGSQAGESIKHQIRRRGQRADQVLLRSEHPEYPQP